MKANFVAGFPKVASQIQSDMLEKLLSLDKPLSADLKNPISFSFLKEAAPNFPQPSVYVGGTAYNWFPAWREIPTTTDAEGSPSLPARTAGYKFSSIEEADIVFALLCSSLGYWWWAISSDGFNLKKWLLTRFPISIGLLSSNAKRDLAKLGAELRESLRKQYVYKDNQGRIGNFYLPGCYETVEKIDAALVRHLEPLLTTAALMDIREFNQTFSRASSGNSEENESDEADTE